MARREKSEALTRADVLRVAARANVDPRTVDRVANRAIPPRSMVVEEAIAAALEAEGFPAAAARVRGMR